MNVEVIREKCGVVILKFAVPAVIAMVLTSMVNIIDGYFVGNCIGTEGLAAVSLGLPIVYLYLAVGLMLAVGGVSIAGRMLGAGDTDAANQVFRQTMTLCIGVTLILTLIMRMILSWIAGWLHADALTKTYFTDYYAVMLFELPLMVLISAAGMFIRGEGNPVFIMISNMMTVLLNTIFDYLFIGPLSLGMKGAAYASLLSAAIVAFMSVGYFLLRAKVFRLGQFSFQTAVVREMILNGSSEFIGELAMCISMAAYNYVVLRCAGVDGVAAFTIVGYVAYVFSMVIIGFGQGMVPLVSFTFGAKEGKLSEKVRNTTIRYVVFSAVEVFIVLSFSAGWFGRLFTDSENVLTMAVPGLRLQMSSFAFAGFNTLVSFYFTAIGKAKESAVISAMRGLIVLMTAIFVLTALFGMMGVWFVSLVTELITMIVSVIFISDSSV